MEHIATGIEGFDELVEGGLPKGSNILLVGPPGAGKTIFALQYLYNGAKAGEPGVYVSFDMTPERLRIQASQLGMDLESLEKESKIAFIGVPLHQNNFDLFDTVKGAVDKLGAKRLVFDNLATFAINMDLFTIPIDYAGNEASSVELNSSALGHNKVNYNADTEKRIIYLITREMTKFGTTNLLVTYANPEGTMTAHDGISEFACDGYISMKSLTIGDTLSRTLEVKKMRYTKMNGGIKSYEIGDKGISFG